MEELVNKLSSAPKSTPVKVYLWSETPMDFPGCDVFQAVGCQMVLGQWEDVAPVLKTAGVQKYLVECDRRNSRLPLMALEQLSARVEPGAILREGVSLSPGAVVLMGAVVNVGASIGKDTMVDMGAVIGSGAQIGCACHIGANAVIAGVLEPASNNPVVIEDRVLIGAGAVVLEGLRVGADAVVAAGAVVTEDVAPAAVVAGCPARFIKHKDSKTVGKTALTDGLRE